MSTYLWQGTEEVTPGKSSIQITPSKYVGKQKFSGPFDSLQADGPQLGVPLTGFPSTALVTEVIITQLDGSAGEMEVTVEEVMDPTSLSSDALGASTYEIEWGELTKPIETHPNCGVLNPDRPNAPDGTKRTWENWADLTDSDYTATPIGGVTQGSVWTLAQYQSLKAAGVDSYNVAYPTIRRTTEHLAPPADVGAGTDKLQDPPSAANFSNVEGFQWLGGPDRCTKHERIFTRQTEWVGAWYWSNLVYTSG